MNKPEDIPQGVWDVAYEATGSRFDPYSRQYVSSVARAIMAEREACAEIADPIETDDRMNDYEKQCYDLRDAISQQIRNRP